MIVKVQLSLSTNCKKQQMFIYNKTRSVFYQDNATKQVVAMCKAAAKRGFGCIEAQPHMKVFFDAQVKGTKIILGNCVQQQSW